MPSVERQVNCTWNRSVLQVVEVVNQLAEPSGTASIEAEYEPWELPYGRFIEFFLQWAALFKGAVGE